MKSLSETLEELTKSIEATPFQERGASSPIVSTGDLTSDVIRDSNGRICRILQTHADGRIVRKVIERNASGQITRVIESTSPALAGELEKIRKQRAAADVSDFPIARDLRKRSAALRAEDRKAEKRFVAKFFNPSTGAVRRDSVAIAKLRFADSVAERERRGGR